MRDSKENFQPEIPSRATARTVFDGAAVSWMKREIDIAALRRFFIRCIAAEAMRELNRERQNEQRNS
jgi:hypothetical protein